MPRTMEKNKLQESYKVNEVWPAITVNKKKKNLLKMSYATIKYVIKEKTVTLIRTVTEEMEREQNYRYIQRMW